MKIKNLESNKTTALGKRIVLPIVVLGIIAAAALSSANLANATQEDSARETLVSRLSSKFGLNETEVRETFNEFKLQHDQERHDEMEAERAARLETAVSNGDLTSDQLYALLEKHEEHENDMDDLYNLTSEERREARADMHEEMESWANENDIDLEKIGRFEKSSRDEGGMGMHRSR